MPDTPEKGPEQAADKGDATATAPRGDASEAKAPDAESLHKEYAELKEAQEKMQKELQQWQGRYGNAERKIREQGAELGRYRKIIQDSTGESMETVSDDTGRQEDFQTQAALARSSWVMLTQERPEAVKLKPKVEEILNDDKTAGRFQNDDPYVMYSNIVDHIVRKDERKELADLREYKNKMDRTRETQAEGAMVSGSAASVPMEDISQDEVKKMSAEEMEKRFGKAALLKGLLG